MCLLMYPQVASLFPYLSVINNDAMNIMVRMYFQINILIFGVRYPGVEMLGHMEFHFSVCG